MIVYRKIRRAVNAVSAVSHAPYADGQQNKCQTVNPAPDAPCQKSCKHDTSEHS